MVEGDQALVLGQVETQFNMDIQGNVLRVVSGSRWGSNRTNYIQTFDVTDIDAITEIARDDFGDNEDLYATLFVGNKAFFVTYFRTDPFHAFFDLGQNVQLKIVLNRKGTGDVFDEGPERLIHHRSTWLLLEAVPLADQLPDLIQLKLTG